MSPIINVAVSGQVGITRRGTVLGETKMSAEEPCLQIGQLRSPLGFLIYHIRRKAVRNFRAYRGCIEIDFV